MLCLILSYFLCRGMDDSLVVHFNLHINIRKLVLDAAELFLVLLSEMRRSDSDALAGLDVDEESVEIQGMHACAVIIVALNEMLRI